jgi:uncharacterized cupredoxin-like copper-binding protein
VTRARATRVWVVVAALLVGVATTTGGYAVAGADDRGPASGVLGPGTVNVRLGVEHSRFSQDELVVERGTTVRFEVVNDDPIGHELIVGDAEVHRRHAEGTERFHPPVPGEVSVAPGDTSYTIFTFDEVGPVVFACHLPGHVAYGMEGTIEVRASG